MFKQVLRLPLWLGELVTGSKSFEANPLIGSRRLNRCGLHVARVTLAHGIMRLRMAMLVPVKRPRSTRSINAGWLR